MVYVWRFCGSVACKQKKIQALRKYTEKQNDFKIQVPAGYWEQHIKFKRDQMRETRSHNRKALTEAISDFNLMICIEG